jgi:putative flippase GtrA
MCNKTGQRARFAELISAPNVRIYRYILNGLVATAVHYIVLVFCMEVIRLPYAGVANFIASSFGMATSFLGNRYFVFPGSDQVIHKQAVLFILLYASIALLNGLILFIMTDIFGILYHVGFIFSVIVQFVLSYLGNKHIVFVSRVD